ncbi:MAG: ligand-binding sensor domain-containing protein, partial [Bacteroidales bacterium]
MKTPINLFHFIFAIFFFFQFEIISATDNKYFFKQLSLEEGLSQSFVNSIYEDYKGFLWVGTRNGLNKYDTRNFRTYYKNNGDATSLPDDFIHFIVEDSLKNLWISTNQGLTIYDREN